ncbi:DUF1823 family protein [Trichothermofontia sp.]
MMELPPLDRTTIQAIVADTLPDEVVNQLVWRALGYRYDPVQRCWDNRQVAAEWRDRYPEPPNFLESRPATVQLTRSIPPENKQLLKEELGFAGYKVGELQPRLTRRATAANWLLSYLKQTES